MSAALVIACIFWLLGITRTIYPYWGGLIGKDYAIAMPLVTAGIALLAFSLPFSPVLALTVLAFSAWFAWSTRVPRIFKEFSFERLVGTKNYRVEDVPDTVWKRPKFVDRHWPTWL